MFPPLWQIRMPVGMMNFPIYWKIKHVPNHQPENLLRWWFMHHHSHIHTHTKKNDPAMNQSFTTPTPFMSCMSQHVPSTLSGPCGKCPSCSFRTANCCGWCPINATQLTWWVAFTLQIHRNPTETNKQKLGKNYIYIHIYIYIYICGNHRMFQIFNCKSSCFLRRSTLPPGRFRNVFQETSFRDVLWLSALPGEMHRNWPCEGITSCGMFWNPNKDQVISAWNQSSD